MFERFARDAKEKVRRAAELAEAEQASMVEVEHLLTALVDPVSDSVGQTLDIAATSGARRITNETLLLAIVGAEVGIMPSLLHELGTSREQIEELVRPAA